MPVWLIVMAAFVAGTGFVAAVAAGFKYLPEHRARRRIEARMRETGLGLDAAAPAGEMTVVKRQDEGPLAGLEHAIKKTRGGGWISRLIEQSGTRVSPSSILMAAVAAGLTCAVVAAVCVRFVWAPMAGLVVGLVAPFVILRRRRSRRMHRFEEQLPDALDLLSRAIRAGHAFTTAMGMVASEAIDPIGPEFRKTYDEQNFGLPLKEALNNLATRMPLLDVRFFVTAVLIQRETGGNLSEILDNLAYVVRERFKVLRQVRVYTAHGRFTGWVLMALPAALAIVLMLINPEHMNLLFTERMGHVMLTIAVVLQIIGFIWIKKVVKIEV